MTDDYETGAGKVIDISCSLGLGMKLVRVKVVRVKLVRMKG
jgi:hypothetical protein